MNKEKYLIYLSKCHHPEKHIYSVLSALMMKREILLAKLKEVKDDIDFLHFVLEHRKLLKKPLFILALWNKKKRMMEDEGNR